MKKNVYLLVAMAMVALMSVGFTSCSSDDEESETLIDSPIIGTWKTGISGVEATIIFNKNATVTYVSIIKGTTKRSEGTFEVSSGSDGIVKIYWKDSNVPEFLEFKIVGNKMTTNGVLSSKGELTWTKQ